MSINIRYFNLKCTQCVGKVATIFNFCRLLKSLKLLQYGLGGSPRMCLSSTWSGRERSSHSEFSSVPRIRLANFSLLISVTARSFIPGFFCIRGPFRRVRKLIRVQTRELSDGMRWRSTWMLQLFCFFSVLPFLSLLRPVLVLL